tara:strand:- start:300 stop:455 length:156 start_codon:yes stop_codon:yes gene_type:complete
MRGTEAREIIDDMVRGGKTIEYCCDDSEVTLDGTFTIEELQAVLHKMEYDD